MILWPFFLIFGVAIGSFINVLSLRYEDGSHVILTKRVQGRSHCMSCQKVLCWYELIPVLSFAIQCGVCRGCKAPLKWQYPVIELITGILTATLPLALYDKLGGHMAFAQHQSLVWIYAVIALWLLISYTAITLSAIDLRLQIIPDQCTILMGVLALALLGIRAANVVTYPSFLGSYSSAFGALSSPLINALIALGIGLALFGGIVFFTRGRGMGLGDVKLAVPIALLLGWPDVIVSFSSAFIVGAVVGILMILRRKAAMKSMVPFGPFLILGIFITVFYGETLVRWYFGLV